MAQLQWTRPIATPVPRTAPGEPGIAERLLGRFLDWEDWLTFALALGALLGVSLSLEENGWSRDMPPITLVGVLALLAALLFARSPLHMLVAWPLAVLTGAVVLFWRTLEMVGPGNLEQRIDAIYLRFQTWFELAFGNGISNDSLPFNVLVIGLTWLGVFSFGWSIYRWHNAWLGLIPGGVALFMNLLFIDDTLPFGVFAYALFGFLLVMRTNLMARMRAWRAEGVAYPPLISLTFLHYTLWAGLLLLAASWVSPVGPFPTPRPVEAFADQFQSLGVDFVRLAGPLRSNKIIPVHDYTSVLPFQGSIDLGERELLLVEVNDATVEGPIVLRGTVYDQYASGGWRAGHRQEFDFPDDLEVLDNVGREGSGGRIVPITVTVRAKSVVGSVLFAPGQLLSANVPARVKLVPETVLEMEAETADYTPSRGALFRQPYIRVPRDGGASLSDEDVLDALPPSWTGLYVKRSEDGRVTRVGMIPPSKVFDALVLRPEERVAKGGSYSVLGLVRDFSAAELRAAGKGYPAWVRKTYLSLPEIPDRVAALADKVAGGERTPYDKAKAVESYLREYPVDYGIGDTPPGRDTVDYFLFDAKAGYFDYHASAMIVMLRSLGVPSRLAVGFVADKSDYDADSGGYLVRDEDVYAWAEVYFPDIGWVEFNPSPDRPADLRPRATADEIEGPPVSLEDLRDLPVSISGLFPPGSDNVTTPPAGPSSDGSGSATAPLIALGVAAFLAALAGSAALGWRRSVAGLPYAQQLWEKTVRLASWGGLPPRPGQTPAAFARVLSRRYRDAREVELLAEAYNRSRFGRRDVDSDERERLARVWRDLRGLLAWKAVRRLWRRG